MNRSLPQVQAGRRRGGTLLHRGSRNRLRAAMRRPILPRGKPPMPVLLLLTVSNAFMTIAWYWHIKGAGLSKPLALVVLISWGIALVEYCFAVPANRMGALAGWTPGQLKIAQEAISLTVFGLFMVTALGEPLHWRHLAAFACLMGAVGFLFAGR